MRGIDTHNINYPKSFAKLTDDQNTNTILNAIANRAIHLNKKIFAQIYTVATKPQYGYLLIVTSLTV